MDGLYMQRIREEVIKTPTFQKELVAKVKEKQGELNDLKRKNLRNKVKKYTKFLDKKNRPRSITRSPDKHTVHVNQPVYTSDKSRFFNAEYEEEKRLLFFS